MSGVELSCAELDTIPDVEESCTGQSREVCIQYTYDLVEGCLTRTEEGCSQGSSIPPNAFRIIVQEFPSIEETLVRVAGNLSFPLSVRCSEADTPSAVSFTRSVELTIGGQPILVTFTMSRTDGAVPTVFVTNIAIAPA